MNNSLATSPVMEEGEAPTPTDPIFNRLLKDRIIWLGDEVKDANANVICAQMLMLAAEDPEEGYLALHQFAWWLHYGGHGHL